MSETFKVGDPVIYRGKTYTFPGHVCGITDDGQYIVRAIGAPDGSFAGMKHIYGATQLQARDETPPAIPQMPNWRPTSCLKLRMTAGKLRKDDPESALAGLLEDAANDIEHLADPSRTHETPAAVSLLVSPHAFAPTAGDGCAVCGRGPNYTAHHPAPRSHVVGPTLEDFARRLFDLHGFMLLETYNGKHAVTVTFPDLQQAQQFHGALVELSTHRPRLSSTEGAEG